MKQNVHKFLIIIFTLNSTFSTLSSAQSAPDKDWDYTFGGQQSDTLSTMKQTSDGGFMLAGRSSSSISGNKTQNTKGLSDYWIVKLNYAGVKLWDYDFGGSSYDVLTSFCETSSGNFIFAGYSNSGISGDKSQETRGKYDFWIVKTNASGIKIWDKRYGGSNNDLLIDIHETTDGGFILGGYSDSGADGDKTQTSQGANDYWIVKTDSNGNKLWDARFGGCSDDNLFTVIQTTDGGYLLGGLTHSLISCGGDIEQAGYGGKDYWIVKTDANGNKQWTNRFGGNDRDILRSIIETASGYLLAGLSASDVVGDQTNAKRGKDDYWLIKTDLNGAKIWDKRYGGNKSDVLNDMHKTSDGGYVLGGYSASGISGEKTQNPNGGNDYWIVKIDSGGILEYDKTIGGFENDELSSVFQGVDCGLILGGTSKSAISGDKSENNFGSTDYWCVRLKADLPKIYFADADADGYGDLHDSISSCSPIAGRITTGGDCNDFNNTIHPGSIETCNGLDDNCNGIIDENAAAPQLSGAISGATVGVCKDTVTYSITAVNGALGYTWGALSLTIVNGQGTTSADFSFPANFISDSIKVYAYNECGAGNILKLGVTGKPAKPIKITGPSSVCANSQNISYSISPVFGATSYTWTPPSGVVITAGQGSTNVKVNWGTVTGDIKVKSVNSCGSSGTIKKTVKVTCKVSDEQDLVSIYPDPVHDQCNIQLSIHGESNGSIHLFDMMGNEVFYRNDGTQQNDYSTNFSMKNFSAGMYLLQVICGSKVIEKQIIKQ
ncbi:MAG: T9SS type A sorting domain-containing protein [Chitinophagales bacterium]|nr:T9SS type A sorting domain-containing protein [Chitinophagales bacterium]